MIPTIVFVTVFVCCDGATVLNWNKTLHKRTKD